MSVIRSEPFTGSAGFLPDPPWLQATLATSVNYSGTGTGVAASGTNEAIAYDHTSSYPDDQYAQQKITSISSGHWAKLYVRASGNISLASFNAYSFITDGTSGATHTAIVKWVDSTPTELANFATTFAAGDVMKISVVGTLFTGSLITVYKNGVSIGTFNDTASPFSSGAAGMGLFDTGAPSAAIDDWEGGSLGTSVSFDTGQITVEGYFFGVGTPNTWGLNDSAPVTLAPAFAAPPAEWAGQQWGPPPFPWPVAGGTAVAFGTGFLTVIGFAPTVVVSNNQAVVFGAGALAVTGFAPTIVSSNHKIVVLGTGALTVTGFAPAIVVSNNQATLFGIGSVVVTGFAPTVIVSNNQVTLLGTGAVVVTGFAPTIVVSNNQGVLFGTGALSVVGFPPTVFASDSRVVLLATGALDITGFAPTVTVSTGNNQSVLFGLGALLVTGFAPGVINGQNTYVDLGVGALLIQGYAPEVIGDINVPPLGGVGSKIYGTGPRGRGGYLYWLKWLAKQKAAQESAQEATLKILSPRVLLEAAPLTEEMYDALTLQGFTWEELALMLYWLNED